MAIHLSLGKGLRKFHLPHVWWKMESTNLHTTYFTNWLASTTNLRSRTMEKMFSPKLWMWLWSVLCLKFGKVSPPGCMANLSLQRFTALAAVFFWKIWSPLENCLGIGQVFWKVWECPVMSRVGQHASTRYIYISENTPTIPTQSYTIQTFLQLLDIYFLCLLLVTMCLQTVSRVDFPTCRCPYPLRTWYRQNGCFKLLQLRDTKSLHTIYIYIYN